MYENLSHQLAFWYKALNLQIPQAATMTGGLYLWKDGRDVPDTMNVTFQQAEQMLVSWDSGLGNSQLGITEDVLGSDGTISRSPSGIRYLPQKVNRPEGAEMAGKVVSFPTAHMQNFVDCIRSGKEPHCPFELGYRVSIACRMALESFHQGRTVRLGSADGNDQLICDWLAPAADFENRAGHIRGCLREQPKHTLRDFVRRSGALHRYSGIQPCDPPGFAIRRMQASVHQARCDSIHSNTFGRHFARQSDGKSVDRALRSGVVNPLTRAARSGSDAKRCSRSPRPRRPALSTFFAPLRARTRWSPPR